MKQTPTLIKTIVAKAMLFGKLLKFLCLGKTIETGGKYL